MRTVAPSFTISDITRSAAGLFSDLTHYARSGDFVVALVGESQNLNEHPHAPRHPGYAGYTEDFNATVENYRVLLTSANITGFALPFALPNNNFDPGALSAAGEYAGADLTCDKLLDTLASPKFAGISPELRAHSSGLLCRPQATHCPIESARHS
jgi:hypothetical protein